MNAATPSPSPNAIAPELAKKGQVVLKLPAEEDAEDEEEAASAAACDSAASDWLRMAELDTEDEDAECDEEEEKKEPEEAAADAAIPPEPRTKTELSSDGAIRAICNVYRQFITPLTLDGSIIILQSCLKIVFDQIRAEDIARASPLL